MFVFKRKSEGTGEKEERNREKEGWGGTAMSIKTFKFHCVFLSSIIFKCIFCCLCVHWLSDKLAHFHIVRSYVISSSSALGYNLKGFKDSKFTVESHKQTTIWLYI